MFWDDVAQGPSPGEEAGLGPFYEARISAVRPGSPAQRMGLRPGDLLLSLNDHPLRDVIDYRFYAAEDWVEIVMKRGHRRLVLKGERPYEEELGLEFEEAVFDGLRRCQNRCPFCFLEQLPPGLRPSLYVKDDDYRYSFLWGNFITLSNWSEEDWARMAEQRLSPLYLSVHATDLDLRRRLFGNPNMPEIKGQLRRLGTLGIEVHAQIVVVPGLNDGPHLAQTVFDLAEHYPTVQSIAVVPVGLTKHHKAGLRLTTPSEAHSILDLLASWRREFKERYGRYLVHAADELYLLAGRPFPQAEEYEGFPHLENGVGLVRRLLDEYEEAKTEKGPHFKGVERATLVCGTLIAPLWERMVGELSLPLEVIPLENRLFGPTVTVSGLLVGQDLVSALRGRDLGRLLFLPRSMFEASGQRTLDHMTLEEIEAALQTKAVVAEGLREVIRFLTV